MMLDSSKIGKIKPYTFARIEDINVLITDNEFPDALKEQFKEKDIVVILPRIKNGKFLMQTSQFYFSKSLIIPLQENNAARFAAFFRRIYQQMTVHRIL